MDIEHNINFNDPVEVTEIFRFRDDSPEKILIEYGSKASFCWEDVMFIKDYCFPDDWKKYPGPKYNLKLRGHPENLLVHGDYFEILKYWTLFRNSYPLFINYGDKD